MDNDVLASLTGMELEEIEPSFFPMPPNCEDYLQGIGLLGQEIGDLTLPPVEVDCDTGPYIGQWKEIENISRKSNQAINNSLVRYFSDSGPEQKIRALFPDEIEHKCWHLINTEEPFNHENLTKAMAIKDSLQALVRKSLEDENFSLQADDRIKLQQFHAQLERNQLQAIDLVKIYQKMLKREHGIIMSARDTAQQALPNGHMNRQPSYESPGVPQRFQNLSTDIAEMQERTRDISNKISQMAGEFQQLHLCTNGNIHVIDSYDVRQNPNPTEVKMWHTIVNLRRSLVQHRRNLIEYHRDTVYPRLDALLNKIHREIREWQRTQAFACNGKFVESFDIDQLEDCCKPTAGVMNLCLEQISNLAQLQVESAEEAMACLETLENLRLNYENLVKKLVIWGLVVEKQPPQVLMKDKKFVCHLRHLVSDGLTIHQFNFTTTVALVTSEVASNIQENGNNTQITTSGEIVNNSKNSDYNDQLKQLRVLMTNMTLKMKMRGDKGRADTVAEEKYCMVFRSQIHLRLANNKEYEVTAQTMSLPIVVISHGKQEADAQATIFWDNAFSDAFRRPFEIPTQVQWSWIIDSLHWLWKKECESETSGMNTEGIGLNPIARKYLTQKLLGHEVVPPDTMVSWKQFNHENLPGKTFTFWKWFFNIMQLVSSPYVRKYWNLRLIHGFISKASCQNMLLQCSPGTFMFRFSDTVLGALSISCYTERQDGILTGAQHRSGYTADMPLKSHRGYEVGHLQPDTVKKFQQRSLPDMVKDIKYLDYLYPNMPKDHVFGSYYTPQPEGEDDGYWRTVVVVRVSRTPSSQPEHVGHRYREALSSEPTSTYWTKDLQVVVSSPRQRPGQSQSPGQAMMNSAEAFSPGSVGDPFSPNLSRQESADFSMTNE